MSRKLTYKFLKEEDKDNVKRLLDLYLEQGLETTEINKRLSLLFRIQPDKRTFQMWVRCARLRARDKPFLEATQRWKAEINESKTVSKDELELEELYRQGNEYKNKCSQ